MKRKLIAVSSLICLADGHETALLILSLIHLFICYKDLSVDSGSLSPVRNKILICNWLAVFLAEHRSPKMRYWNSAMYFSQSRTYLW